MVLMTSCFGEECCAFWDLQNMNQFVQNQSFPYSSNKRKSLTSSFYYVPISNTAELKYTQKYLMCYVPPKLPFIYNYPFKSFGEVSMARSCQKTQKLYYNLSLKRRNSKVIYQKNKYMPWHFSSRYVSSLFYILNCSMKGGGKSSAVFQPRTRMSLKEPFI